MTHYNNCKKCDYVISREFALEPPFYSHAGCMCECHDEKTVGWPYEDVIVDTPGVDCPICGITSFAHVHKKGTKPKDYDRIESGLDKVELLQRKDRLECMIANGIMICRCGKCIPEDYSLPKDFKRINPKGFCTKCMIPLYGSPFDHRCPQDKSDCKGSPLCAEENCLNHEAITIVSKCEVCGGNGTKS